MPYSSVSEMEKSVPSMKGMTSDEKKKMLDVFNAMMRANPGMKEGMAIATAMKKAKMMSESVRVLSEIVLSDITDQDLETHEFEVLKVGDVHDSRYGKFTVTPELLKDLETHFNENTLEIEVALDTNHDPQAGAKAWLKTLAVRGDSLFATFKDYTEEGKKLLKEKIFKYFSVEFAPFKKVIDGQVKTFKNVLRGIALTNRPVIKGMRPAFYSESLHLLFNQHNNMETFKVFADSLLKKAKISAEEFGILKAMVTKLSEEEQAEVAEQVVEVEAKVEEVKEEKPAEKEVEEPAEEVAAAELAETVKAQGKELAELRAERKQRLIKDRVSEVCLSETNLVGFSATDANVKMLSEFIGELSDSQYESFKNVISKAVSLSEDELREIGHSHGDNAKLSEEDKMDKMAKEYMKEHKCSYNEAIRAVAPKVNSK